MVDIKWYECKYNCMELDVPFCVPDNCEHFEFDPEVKEAMKAII